MLCARQESALRFGSPATYLALNHFSVLNLLDPLTCCSMLPLCLGGGGEGELLVVPHTRSVVIEEVEVQNGLHSTREPHDAYASLVIITLLVEIAVRPVEEVQSTITAEAENVMRVQCCKGTQAVSQQGRPQLHVSKVIAAFTFPCPLQHKQLR